MTNEYVALLTIIKKGAYRPILKGDVRLLEKLHALGFTTAPEYPCEVTDAGRTFLQQFQKKDSAA